jgi:hypothetical protein
MKKHFLLFSLSFALLFGVSKSYGQSQSAPPPPDSHGQTTNQTSGGGAPIGGGLFILLGLGAAYGGKKVYDMKKQSLEE